MLLELQDGCLRLVFPDRPSFQIWNTPVPPSLALCRAYPADVASCQNFYAIEMDRIDGVTFFFCTQRLFGLYVHQLGESCAMDFWNRTFSNRPRRSSVWIYMPISKQDRPLLLGVRESRQSRNQCFVIRTKLVGDVVVRPQCLGAVRDANLGTSAPVTMIYGDPQQGRSECFFGAYCRVPADQGLTKPFCLPNPSGSPLGNEAYYSCAPLNGVISALVFYDEITGACRGILFCYWNGGKRAVGQCRLQVDPSVRVAQPLYLCFRVDSWTSRYNITSYRTRVRFKQASQATGGVEEEGWETRRMEGIVKFWFTLESCFIVVEDQVEL